MFTKLLYQSMSYHFFSRLISKFMLCKIGFLKNWIIRRYMKAYRLNLDEAIIKDIREFDSFNAFFTREIDLSRRPLCDGDTLASPVDGTVSAIGPITGDSLLQAKGHQFTVSDLIGSKQLADLFENGHYATLYLSPKDYHRIHMPVSAKLFEMITIPGSLYSVNPYCVANVPNLFARNERVACLFDSPNGPIGIVLVGATIVASIATVWSGVITPPKMAKTIHTQYPPEEQVHLEKGEELGRFLLGSTVILLLPPDTITWSEALKPGTEIRLGECLAKFIDKSGDS